MQLGSLRNDTAEIFAQRGSKRETDLANLAKMSALHLQPSPMIRLGQRIRLTRREVERFTKITAIAPVNVCTLDDLAAYVLRCKTHYWGVSRETQFLHWLIDREYEQCRHAA